MIEPANLPAPMRGPDDPAPSGASLPLEYDGTNMVPKRKYRTVWHVEYCPNIGDYCYVTTCGSYEDAERFVARLSSYGAAGGCGYRNFHITGPHQHDVTE